MLGFVVHPEGAPLSPDLPDALLRLEDQKLGADRRLGRVMVRQDKAPRPHQRIDELQQCVHDFRLIAATRWIVAEWWIGTRRRCWRRRGRRTRKAEWNGEYEHAKMSRQVNASMTCKHEGYPPLLAQAWRKVMKSGSWRCHSHIARSRRKSNYSFIGSMHEMRRRSASPCSVTHYARRA